MNYNEIKTGFDAISPTQEQKDRMLANILSASETAPVVKHIQFKRYIPAVAAACIGIFVLTYFSFDKGEIVTEKPSEVKVSVVTDLPAQKSAEDIENDDIKISLPNEEKQVNQNNPAYDTAPAEKPQPEIEYQPVVEQPAAENVIDIPVEKDMSMSRAGGGGGVSSASIITEEYDYAAAEEEGTDTAVVFSAEAEHIKLSQSELMQNEKFAKYIPQRPAEGYVFSNADMYGDDLYVHYKNNEKSIYITLLKKLYEIDTIKPEQIGEITSEYNTAYFALDCGEYYVQYEAPTEDIGSLYDMAVSCEYYN